MNTILYIVLALAAAYFLYSRLAGGGVPSISKREIKELRAQHPNLEIIDVRTPQEIAGGKMKGAHEINFMSSDFQKRISKLPKDRPYLVYCRSGRRSAGACSVMLKQGFEQVYNLSGGYGG